MEALAIAYGMESEQFHPIARSICAFAKSKGAVAQVFTSPTVPLFQGERQIGVEVRAATNAFRLESNIRANERLMTQKQGNTVSLYSKDTGADEPLATFFLEDELRTGVADTIQNLKSALKLRIRILSGDQAGPVANLLMSLNLEPETGLSGLAPKAKAEYIGNHADDSESLMIGDGANDAEALKRSFASIAVKGDLSVCLDSADAVLVVDSVTPVKFAFQLAHQLRRTLLATLLLSASINVIAAYLAISGTITPLIAAVLMPTSGLIVTFTTWQMLREKSITQKTNQKKRIL
jgi:P-type E1-E2 ATPase